DRRMSYTNVNAIIEKNDARRKEQFARFVPMFFLMKKLSDLLRGRRKKRGGIDFDFPESKILLDKKGRVTKIEPYERNSAQLLIEDFMLAANETVAEDYYWQQLPFLYRVHEAPDPEKMRALSVFVENFGYYIRGGKTADSVHPRQLQELLAKVTGASEEALIARLTLRSMKQAKYDVSCSGHFGLAAKFYTHFTSPIRRYPDLQIHRIIKENLRHGLSDARISHYEKLLPGVAEESSRLERRADEAERECDKMKKCEYMRQFLGKTFEGVISGVTSFGFYVELPNTCEGLVHVNTLTDDYYVYYEGTMELKGERTLRSFKLGQPVSVQVTDADKVMRTIDFRLAPKEPSLVE
ncbi:MAG: RNB domain-containing ribonuclease, partial [Eubacteriales bacterium]|nr:RNB domain-containing ribonuclease [Eubacteriales bacterium]